ncbi:NTP transferase domain-containing protein [Sphingomonas sp. BK580]|uniref:phosphocholine cytidylyltransferase family protein n=1 Tax=Sphingomonas sp. BK580 TaxID=2586972 RepID=UPI001610ABD9|nr:NTP transferase domain-containing protein [Sphingomonas sp. BK580]MBB3693589.1 choline kinase [Sphingomonas sp. BK580]
MRAVILSAGRGSRLLPLTELMPKCLVPVGGRAILDHQLTALAEAGATSVILVAGYRFDQVGTHLATHPSPLPVDLRFNPFWSVSSSIGSAWMARDAFHEAFCLMNGDTTLSSDILTRALSARCESIALLVEPLARPATDDMLVRVEEGKVLAVSKTIDPAAATHRSLGVVVGGAASAYGAVLERVIAGEHGILAYHHDVVAALAAQGQVAAIEVREGGWAEIDRADDVIGWSALMERTS